MLNWSVSSEIVLCFLIMTSIFRNGKTVCHQMDGNQSCHSHIQSTGTEAMETYLSCFLGKHKVPHLTNHSAEPSSHLEIRKFFS